MTDILFKYFNFSNLIHRLLLTLILLHGMSQTVFGLRNSSVPMNINKELFMTSKERLAFDQFKSEVYSNITEPELVLPRTDLYLLRLLRAKKLDVEVAKRELFEFLRFIRENDMLHMPAENWEEMKEQFPVHFGEKFVDLHGRPYIYITSEEGWLVRRKIMVENKSAKLQRYFFKVTLDMQHVFVEAAKKDPAVTQIFALLNLVDFDMYNQGCYQCLLQYVQFLELFQRFIPGYVHEIVLFNVPKVAYIALNAIRPIISNLPLKVFGNNPLKWKRYLEGKLGRDQLASLLDLK